MQFPIDLEHFKSREQLKKSGLVKVRVQIMWQWLHISHVSGLSVNCELSFFLYAGYYVFVKV